MGHTKKLFKKEREIYKVSAKVDENHSKVPLFLASQSPN